MAKKRKKKVNTLKGSIREATRKDCYVSPPCKWDLENCSKCRWYHPLSEVMSNA